MSGSTSPGSMVLKLQREKREMTIQVEEGQTFLDVLTSAGLMVDGVLVFHDGAPVPLDTDVDGYNEATIINVASGG